MNDNGWICLYRDLLNKPIWKQGSMAQRIILITLLLMVNHEENEIFVNSEKIIVKPGQTFTSLDKIAQKAGQGISTKAVRCALEKFEKMGFAASVGASGGRLITIENWALYQGYSEDKGKGKGKQGAKQGQSKGKQGANSGASNNNINNDNNENNETMRTKKENDATTPAYGEYANVILSDEELRKLQSEFPYDWQQRIDRLSEYIASKGAKYKSHFATIRAWARKDKAAQPEAIAASKWAKWEKMQDDLERVKPDYQRMSIPSPNAFPNDIENYIHVTEARWRIYYNDDGTRKGG